MKSIREIQSENSEWAVRNFPNSELWMPVMGAGEECGELFHSILKMYQGIRGTKGEHLVAAEDAIGDIVIYLMDVCNKLEIDLETVVNETWDTVINRDWVERPNTG